MEQAAIEFQNVSKRFKKANDNAVSDASFSVQEGELVTILGSSGCGKTTMLKMINRLYEPDEGKILLFGEDISQIDPVLLRRKIGYVIQQVGLFPHMTVAENIASIPKLLHWSKEKTNLRVKELLEMVGLEPGEFESRHPAQLSGGQQQRVGLARALSASPDLMLLDEPFGAIDAITRMNLQDELLRIHGGIKKTFLFVTHDINEAFRLGTRVLVMNEGKISQFDTPEMIVKHPADGFVSRLIDATRKQEQFWEEYR